MTHQERDSNKDPERVARGKLGYHNMTGDAMEREFIIQTKVPLLDLANMALATLALGEVNALKTLNGLGQAAFKFALEYVEELVSWNKITNIEDAIEELERVGLLDRGSSSIKHRALFRNRQREHTTTQHNLQQEEAIRKAALREMHKQQVASQPNHADEVDTEPAASQQDTELTRDEIIKRFQEANREKLDNTEPLF